MFYFLRWLLYRLSQNGYNILFVKLGLDIFWSLSDSYYNNIVLFLKRLFWSKIGSDLHANKILMALFLKRIIIFISKVSRVK